jgi:hypothetical protein
MNEQCLKPMLQRIGRLFGVSGHDFHGIIEAFDKPPRQLDMGIHLMGKAGSSVAELLNRAGADPDEAVWVIRGHVNTPGVNMSRTVLSRLDQELSRQWYPGDCLILLECLNSGILMTVNEAGGIAIEKVKKLA